jgi:hypothetical protein
MKESKNSYLTIDEKDNAMDYLIQSLVFLSQIEQNKMFIKWFIIAFHGSLHSFMLLVLQSVGYDQIYEKLPGYLSKDKDFDPFDGKLKGFTATYNCLKNSEIVRNNELKASEEIDDCIKELNDKLRNQFMHFKPMFWASEPWYPASVCLPLLSILRYCINFEKVGFSEDECKTANAYVDSLGILLSKHSEDFDY